MKRFLLLLTVFAMVLALSACTVGELVDLMDEEPAISQQDDIIDELELDEGVEPDDDWDDWDEEEPQPEPEVQPEPEAQPEPEVQPEPEAQPEPEVQPEPEAQPEPEVQPEPEPELVTPEPEPQTSASAIDEDGYYYSKDEVALYIYTYGHLPDNYITKKEAQKLGWEGGKLEPYAPGMAIGGDHFGNYEGLLPKKKGRTYTECDIDTKGKKRGAKRIIFSNDGLIYYTDDHYESFELLYGEP